MRMIQCRGNDGPTPKPPTRDDFFVWINGKWVFPVKQVNRPFGLAPIPVLKEWAAHQVARLGFRSEADYLESLVRDDWKKRTGQV